MAERRAGVRHAGNFVLLSIGAAAFTSAIRLSGVQEIVANWIGSWGPREVSSGLASIAGLALIFGCSAVLNVLVPSASAKALAAGPHLGRLGDQFGLSRDASLAAYKAGDSANVAPSFAFWQIARDLYEKDNPGPGGPRFGVLWLFASAVISVEWMAAVLLFHALGIPFGF